jgi:hypothetical protein
VRRVRFRSMATASVVGVAAILSYGCVVTDGGYGYGGAAYGVGYYEPYGMPYGGWGPGYEVAPFRYPEHHPEGHGGPEKHGGGPPPHAYRAAPASRAMPSIPTGARPAGGGHGGGGGHGAGSGRR